jgi:hypothetical protein
MILSREEADQARRDVEVMQDMGLLSSAEAVLAQIDIFARTVPLSW